MANSAYREFNFGLGEVIDAVREQVQRFAEERIAPRANEIVVAVAVTGSATAATGTDPTQRLRDNLANCQDMRAGVATAAQVTWAALCVALARRALAAATAPSPSPTPSATVGLPSSRPR